ncbi:MAG: outer membrane protein assembly factor BamA [Chthoniobacteraceae bacterium]
MTHFIRLTPLLAILAALSIPLTAVRAQTAAPAGAPEAPIVRQIDIQYAGPATLSKEKILANMRTAVGKPYSEEAVEDDIRSLYATGSVTNVRIFGEPVQDGVRVVVVIQSKANVATVEIVGATSIPVKKLRKDISTKPGQTLNEANLEQDRQKILDEYANKGYSETQVSYHTDVNDQTGAAAVTFTIIEGNRTVVKAVLFEGNYVFTSKELKKVVKTKPANILSFLMKTGRVNSDQLDDDVSALREYYQNHGYEDATIAQPLIEPAGDGKVTVTYPITEGPQYHVGTLVISGEQVFTEAQVGSRLKTHPDGVFSPQDLRDDTKAVGDLYGERGYIDMTCTAETTSGADHIINVAYKIDEGSQSYINQINIQGNTRTKDKVIRRELAVYPGEVYDTALIDVSKERLENLGYFNKDRGVQIYPSDTDIPGRKDVNVLVEEARTGSFNFGAGFSSIDSLLGFVEVQQTNFDLLNWPTFTGGGERFHARFQLGTERTDADVSLTEPYFLDYQLSVGDDIFYSTADYVSDVYEQKNYGDEVDIRKPLNAFSSLRLAYRLEDIKIYDISSGVSQDILRDAGNHTKSSLTLGYTYDSRDSVFLTRKGERLDASVFLSGGPLGGEVNDWGLDVTGSKYFLLPGDTILLINAEWAEVENFGDSDWVPLFDALYLGGPNSLRGFRFRAMSPYDNKGQPIGGDSLGRVTAEYTFPLMDRVRGAAFYDTGFVNRGAFDMSLNELGSDVGLGLRLDLPIGPVRLDYGIPIQNPHQGNPTGQFNFSIGYQF